MGEKGEKTKKRICMAAYKLFAEKRIQGCDNEGHLQSRPDSAGEVCTTIRARSRFFLEIVTALMDNQENEFKEKIGRHIPAAKILEDVLSRYEGK